MTQRALLCLSFVCALGCLSVAEASPDVRRLDGTWNVSWGQLVEPTSLHTLAPGADTLSVPSVWDIPEQYRRVGSNPTLGCATLWRDMTLPIGRASRDMGLYLPELDSASRVYLVASERAYLIHAVGQVSCEPATEVPLWRAQLERLPEGLSGGVRLVWQISNHHFVRGGPVNAPELGAYSTLAQRTLLGMLWGAGLMGLLLVLALYHFSIAYQRREETASRYFALLCLILAIRQGVVMRLFERLSDHATLEGFVWRDRIEYFTMLFAVVVALRFLAECVPSTWIRRTTIFAAAVAIVYGAVILFTDPIVFAGLVGWYQAAMVVALIISMVEGLRLAMAGNRMAGWAILGWLPLGVAALLDVLKSQDLIDIPYASTYGLIAMAVIQGVVLARRFADASRTAERLTENLKEEVAIQTDALQSQKDQALALLEELKTVQSQLIEAGRLATVGRISSGLAHELRNPLNISQGGAEVIEESMNELLEAGQLDEGDVAPIRKALAMIQRGGDRVNALISRIQELAEAREGTSVDPIEALPAIRSVFDFVNESLSNSDIRYSLSAPNDADWMMRLSNTAISQVMLNLFTNAQQALQARGYGHVTVTCREELREDKTACLVIDVCDDGPGVPEELRATLFEPFVSGHTTLDRSGMGLAISRQIMTEAGGSLTLEPTSVGAHFRVVVPLDGVRADLPLSSTRH